MEHESLGVRTSLSRDAAGLIVLEPSRKHGHFDRRWAVPFISSISTTPNGAAAESVAGGLSWETFCETSYPGTKRHDFRAISAWNRYRDTERSRPEGSRRRAPELIARGRSS